MPKLCEFENCRKQASYGECSGKPLRCSQHKENYKLVSTFCEYIGCNKNPTYNIKGEKKRRFCCLHKSDDMINIKDFTKKNDRKLSSHLKSNQSKIQGDREERNSME